MGDWRTWLKGLVATAVGGAANSIGVIIADPVTFNFQDGLSNLGTVALTGALTAIVFYLRQSPIPGVAKP